MEHKEPWVEEFDGVLEAAFDKHGESYEVYNPDAFGLDIKEFIRETLASSRDAALAEAMEIVEEKIGLKADEFNKEATVLTCAVLVNLKSDLKAALSALRDSK